MSISMDAANALERVIDGKIAKAAPKRTRTAGTVTRIDQDGTPYVMLDGSNAETPATSTAAAVKPNQRVGVTVGGGQLTIDGNYSAPATDDTTALDARAIANTAVEDAAKASTAAVSAQYSADAAAEAAESAITDAAAAAAAASDAQTSADSALANLKSVVAGATTVEKAVSVMQTALEAVVDYDPTTDTTREWFWHDANGAHVLGDTSGYRNDVTSTGVDIVEVATEKSVAEFGADGARIGKAYDAQATDNESHMELDYHSMQLIGKEGDTYFHVSDFRDTDGYATLVQNFDFKPLVTSISQVELAMVASSISYVKLINAVVDPSSYSAAESSGHTVITFNPPLARPSGPSQSSTIANAIQVEYKTDRDDYKCLTFGSRASSGYPGPLSATFGDSNFAESLYSFASGHACNVTGVCSGAIGELARAWGDCSVALGCDVTASGLQSVAQNLGTKAAGPCQTALGKYNVEDTNNRYALIVGNGTSNSARSNAIGVWWDGTVDMGPYLHIDSDAYNMKSTTNGVTANYWPCMQVRDKNDLRSSLVGSQVYADGKIGTGIWAYNYNSSGTQVGSGALSVYVDKSGNVTYEFSKQPMREAVGVHAYGRLTGMASEQTLTNAFAKVLLNTTTFGGSGCSQYSNGIKVNKAGTYMIWASAYMSTGYTDNDIIHFSIYKNSTNMYELRERTTNANPYKTVNIGPTLFDLAAGDVVYLYAYNQAAARGKLTNMSMHGLYIRQIA